jgi:hypothetical protein
MGWRCTLIYIIEGLDLQGRRRETVFVWETGGAPVRRNTLIFPKHGWEPKIFSVAWPLRRGTGL